MSPGDEEIPLTGGHINAVVKVGTTVRRRVGPWSESVHQLLRILEVAGYQHAPRFLGIDDRGREVLSYIDGDLALHADDAAGRILREFHDAQPVVNPTYVSWNDIGREVDGVAEVICHNDFTPYNAICRDHSLVAMIDFDLSAPGSRTWDLAWTAINWVPLFHPSDHPRQRPDPPESGRRLTLLATAYGHEDLGALVAAIRKRIGHLLAVSDEQRLAGDAWALATEPHLPFWRRVRDYIEDAHPTWL
jgi:Phosphotransferase enzyme family